MRDIKVKRIVPHDDPLIQYQPSYKQIVDMFPECVIIEDQHGTFRFQENKVLNYLFYNNRLDLNQLCIDYHRCHFPLRDYALLNMQLGYSLSGWLDIFEDKLWSVEEDENES